MITEERAEQAINYLSETDEDVANAKADLARAEYILKRVEAREFLCATGNVKERESKARASNEWDAASQDVTTALATYERIRAKRESERIVWDTWRTNEASRRQGG